MLRGLAGRSGWVALGIGANGVGTLVMLAVASHGSAAAPFAAFATWWVVATLMIFPLGVFESLLARGLIAEKSADGNRSEIAGAVLGTAGILVLIAGAACVAADQILTDSIFKGYHGLGIALAIFLVAGFAQSLQRGHATGTDRFRVIAAQLALDGSLRAVGALIGVLVSDDPRVLALLVCSGSILAAVVVHPRIRDWLVRPRLRDPSLSITTTALLLLGAVGPMLINNVSVPFLSAHGGGVLLVGSFAGALTLSRVPVQFGSAVFGPLLNRLSTAIEAGDGGTVRDLTRRTVTLAAGAAGVFTIGFAVFGNLMIDLFLGKNYGLPVWSLALMGASSGVMLIAVVVQVRGAAHQAWRGIAVSWLLAGAAFSGALFLPGSELFRVTFAPLLGAATGLVALAITGRGGRQASNKAFR